MQLPPSVPPSHPVRPPLSDPSSVDRSRTNEHPSGVATEGGMTAGTGLGHPHVEPTSLDRLRSAPGELERLLAEPSTLDRLYATPSAYDSASPTPGAAARVSDAPGLGLAESPEAVQRRARALGISEEPILLDPLVITDDDPETIPDTPTNTNSVVGGHNDEDHHDEVDDDDDQQTTVVAAPPLGTTRDTPRASLAAERVSNMQLAYEAAPEWIGRLSISTPGALRAMIGLIPTEAGDNAVYEFPIADGVRVLLDNTMTDPGHVQIDGEDTGILVHPIRDADGEVTGFAPDTYFGQSELHRLTGVWVALSENASTDDMPVVTAGEGSVRGEEKPLRGGEEKRQRTALENASGPLIADREGRHLERIPDPRTDVSQPDYIDIETGERIDIYSPTGSVNTIRNEVKDKMKNDQADIIVVNVANNERPLQDVLDRIESMPRDRQVTVIDKQGEFHYFDPNVDALGGLGADRESLAA